VTDQISYIRVGSNKTGITGLKEAIDLIAQACKGKTDQEITDELTGLLSRKNYIPDKSMGEYAKAFLRQFKISMGIDSGRERPEGIEIKVLGPGCPRCYSLEKEIMQAMTETGLAADLEHVTDINDIAGYRVMGTPALVINEKVMAVGKIPSKVQLVKWLKEAQK